MIYFNSLQLRPLLIHSQSKGHICTLYSHLVLSSGLHSGSLFFFKSILCNSDHSSFTPKKLYYNVISLIHPQSKGFICHQQNPPHSGSLLPRSQRKETMKIIFIASLSQRQNIFVLYTHHVYSGNNTSCHVV